MYSGCHGSTRDNVHVYMKMQALKEPEMSDHEIGRKNQIKNNIGKQLMDWF
jgi:hypothetical protein